MCGIYGILGTPNLRFERSIMDTMGNVIRHRGPDDDGAFAEGPLLMGMRRLAIIDVTGGQQPISNEDGTVTVVCNGEIYNFRELRKELTARGHTFKSASDTEVIVHLYEEHGEDCAKYLHGMFAFAIWDKQKQKFLLGRDRLGIKPLYLSVNPDRIVFGSELKSILVCPDIERSINREALEEYLALGYVPAPMTILNGIEKLPPGSMLIADRAGIRQQRYWELPRGTDTGKDDDDWAACLSGAMEKAVVSQMVSDVPLGAFLSGGVDSSAVVAYMARNSSRPVKTYSIGFDTDSGGGYYNELPYARQVADLFKTDHHEIVVRPDVASLLPELLWHMDEPIADAAFVTTYLVSKFAREDVTVILSGVGGDELFGGYRRYWGSHLARMYRKIPRGIRQNLLQPTARLLPSDRHSAVFNWFRLAKGFMAGAELEPDEQYEEYIRVFKSGDLAKILSSGDPGRSSALLRAFESACSGDDLRRLIEVDLQTQLPDDLLMLTDKMSMATSLECRVPLLDDELVELAMQMPSHMKLRGTHLKAGMKDALRDILPDSIIDRKKRGFGAPIGAWFKNELSSYLDTVLDEQSVNNRGIFDWEHLRQIKSLHRSNKEDYTDHLLSMMNFEIWCQMYLDGKSHDQIAERLAAA